MNLQCWIVMLKDAKASNNEVCAFGRKPCRLFHLALHAVFQEDFFNNSVVIQMSVCQCLLNVNVSKISSRAG